jgi:hypothetical protein
MVNIPASPLYNNEVRSVRSDSRFSQAGPIAKKKEDL